MIRQWIVSDVCGYSATVKADPTTKEVRVIYTYEASETFMSYDAAQLDTLIAALTEARRAIS